MPANRQENKTAAPARALTIAGSDSGGAAGLQADLKTFTVLNVYGLTAVTAVTAQNSVAVKEVVWLEEAFVAAQIAAVLEDYGAGAIKTGYIGHAGMIQEIAALLESQDDIPLVVDPVLVNHRGERMFGDDVTAAYIECLLPKATIVTPNVFEAEILTGRTIRNPQELEAAARAIHMKGPAAVLIKRARDEAEVVDLYLDGNGMFAFRSTWIETGNTHGSGDTLSAAICAYLALGKSTFEAVEEAIRLTGETIRRGAGWQFCRGHGPVGHF